MDFKHYNHLGFHNPYYFKDESKIKTFLNFEDAMKSLYGNKEIDLSSVVEIMNKGYCFGDKTLITDLKKAPWMAKLKKTEYDWDYFQLPKHMEVILNQEEIANTFFKLLKVELLEYLKNHTNIGILLTGGMDSRIVACVLNSLIKELTVSSSITVTAFTWGNQNSRDVVYASKIASVCGWDWEHLEVTSDVMLDNVEYVARNGCEYSPIHLHAMLPLSKIRNIDCFIAGSFGDSIGRGEYSGIKVENLKPLSSLSNTNGFFRPDISRLAFKNSYEEINKYHQLYPQDKKYQQFELDYQLHYMRRMLNACMAAIDIDIPLYQMFSAPSVYEFIWSIDPKLRNNTVYEIILKNNNKALLDIPWARTGLKYGTSTGVPDNLNKSHHDYGKMIRQDFLPTFKNEILSSEIDKLNIFNMNVLEKYISLCVNKPILNNYSYEGQLIWLISFSKMIKLYSLTTELPDYNGDLDKSSFTVDRLKYQAKYIVKTNKLF